jgi:hypothetical protein
MEVVFAFALIRQIFGRIGVRCRKKTMTRRQGKTKVRKTALHATTDGKVSRISITFDSSAGSISIDEANPASYRSVTYYERESGKDKVLLEMPSSGHLDAFEPNVLLLSQF